MKKYTEFLFEEIEDKGTRTLKWVQAEAEAISDYLADKFDCEVIYDAEYGGMIIIPDKDLIEMSETDKEEFADMFGREFMSIFPNKYSIEKDGEKMFIISPFKEGSEIPKIEEED